MRKRNAILHYLRIRIYDDGGWPVRLAAVAVGTVSRAPSPRAAAKLCTLLRR